MSTRVPGLLVLVLTVGGCNHLFLGDCHGAAGEYTPCCGEFDTYYSADFVCDVVFEHECTGDVSTCGGAASRSRTRTMYCSGHGRYCDGRVEIEDWSDYTSCGADQICIDGQCTCLQECCGTNQVCLGQYVGQVCTCGSDVCDSECCGAGLACTPGGCGAVGPVEDLGILGTITYRSSSPAIAGFSGGPSGELALAADLRGGETLGPVMVRSAGGCLVRFAPDRSLDWLAHLVPAAPTEQPFLAVQIAPNGDILAAGRGGTLTDGFGVDTVVGSTAFLARFSPVGEVLWLRAVTGEPPWIEAKLAAGADGTVAALVRTPAPLTFAGGASPDFQGSGTVLAVYDLDGNLSWARDVASTEQVMVEDDGSVIVAGVDITYTGASDMVVARFDVAGTQQMLASWKGLQMVSSTDDGQGGVTAFVQVTDASASSLPVGQGLPWMIVHLSAAGVADWAVPPPLGAYVQRIVRVPGGYLVAAWDQNSGRVQYPKYGDQVEYVAAMSPSGEWLWTQVASPQYWAYVGVAAGRLVGVSHGWSQDCHAWAIGFAPTAP